MSVNYILKVKELIQETEEAITLVFERPEKGKLNYKPGQFLTFLLTIDNEKIRRSYSLCTSPSVDDYPAVTVKKVINGKVSNYLCSTIKTGDTLEVLQPAGTFTIDTMRLSSRTVVLIGAGSGITPLIGIAKAVLAGEPFSKVYLVYGNRNEQSIIFEKKLQELSAKYKDKLKTIHVLSQPSPNWKGHSGRLNRPAIIKLLESFPSFRFDKADYFICGPEGMMHEAVDALNILQVPKDKIHKESFVSTAAKETGHIVNSNSVANTEVMVIYQGTEYKFKVPASQSILQAALDQDIDLPYSCQSGLCTACMGKCVSGKVRLDETDALSDKELERGYVLTCVGHPVTNDVVIEID